MDCTDHSDLSPGTPPSAAALPLCDRPMPRDRALFLGALRPCARGWPERPPRCLSRAHAAPAPSQGTPGPMGGHPTRARRARPRARRRDTVLTTGCTLKSTTDSRRRCRAAEWAQIGFGDPTRDRRTRSAALDCTDHSSLSHGTPTSAGASVCYGPLSPRLWVVFNIYLPTFRMTPGRGCAQLLHNMR